MKDRCFIYYGNPCTSCLADPEIQSFEDAKRHPVVECPHAADRAQCSPPRFACVRMSGAMMARRVMQCYTEASERTLALDRDLFRLRGALPPTAVEAYVDPECGFKHITEPEQVIQRVWEHACAVLDLEPGERVRGPVGPYTPPAGVPSALLRHTAEWVRGAAPGKVAELEASGPRSATPQPVRRRPGVPLRVPP